MHCIISRYIVSTLWSKTSLQTRKVQLFRAFFFHYIQDTIQIRISHLRRGCVHHTCEADGRINGVVKETKDPRGLTGPDLQYQTSGKRSDNQSNSHDDRARRDYWDTGITMAFSMHYNTPQRC
jgi:hypothetical protein